jgi:zinc transport system permease protein
MIEALQFEFMRNAVLAGLLASIACGLIGSLIVVNRISFLAGGIAHGAYGGIGLALFLAWPLLPTTLAFSVGLALAMGWFTRRRGQRADTAIGVLWAVGMAAGVILAELRPGYSVDLLSYLFGSLLAVSQADLIGMAILDGTILAVVLGTYRLLVGMSYDPEFTRSRGVRVEALHYVMLGLVALSVVVLLRVAGLILVLALLTIPPSVAEGFSPSLGRMMVLSCLLSAAFALAGLALSYWLNLASSAAIIVVGAAAYAASPLVRRVFHLATGARGNG